MKEKLLELGITDEIAEKVLELVKPIQDELEQLKPKQKTKEELELEERVKALEEREKAIADKEKLETFKASAKEKGISDSLVPFLNQDVNLEDVAKAINDLQLSSGFNPQSKQKEDGITKEQFKAMNYSERVKLMTENKALYDALTSEK